MSDEPLDGQYLHDELWLQHTEFVGYCRIEHSILVEMVEFGLLEPRGEAPEQWQFAARDLQRVRRAQRLARDLGVNYEGVAIILDLLEERDEMLCRLQALQRDT